MAAYDYRPCKQLYIEIDDLDYTSFDAQGSKGKMHQLFGSEMNEIINELIEVLASIISLLKFNSLILVKFSSK